MSRSSPTVVVFGATGQQGGSVVRSLLSSSSGYEVLGATRNLSSEAAHKLLSSGVKLIQADLNDRDSVVKALTSCKPWAVFGLTDPVYTPDVVFAGRHEQEEIQGRNLVDAVIESKVEYFVWSSLPDLPSVPHAHFKAQVEKYARSKMVVNTNAHEAEAAGSATGSRSGVSTKLMVVFPSFFYENWFQRPPSPSGDGSFILTQPAKATTVVAGYSASLDTGVYVEWMLQNPDRFIGKQTVMSAGELSFNEMAEAFSQVFHKKVIYQTTPSDVFRERVPKPMADTWLPMFKVFDENPPRPSDDAEIRAKATKFKDWLLKMKDHPKFAALREGHVGTTGGRGE